MSQTPYKTVTMSGIAKMSLKMKISCFCVKKGTLCILTSINHFQYISQNISMITINNQHHHQEDFTPP